MPHGKKLSSFHILVNDLRELFRLFRSTRRRRVATHPGETARLFIRLVDQGRFVDAIALLPRNIIKALGVDRLESLLSTDSREIRERGGVARIDILGDSMTPVAATVDVSIRYNDGSVDTESIGLMNEGGVWRIDMLA